MGSESNGKVALVIGGGTGMGYASALRLAARGFSLVTSGRREQGLRSTIFVDGGQTIRAAMP